MANAFIPYGIYWSTPFAKWQGSIAHLNSIRLAANCARRMLDERKVDRRRDRPRHPRHHQPAARRVLRPAVADRDDRPGPASRARPCSRPAPPAPARCRWRRRRWRSAAPRCALVVTADRCSNGPIVHYPDPTAPGGNGHTEKWVHGQLRPRSLREDRDDRHRRERRAPLRRRHRRDERRRAAALRAVPGRAGQRPRLPEALHAGGADHRRGLPQADRHARRPTKACSRPPPRAWPS